MPRSIRSAVLGLLALAVVLLTAAPAQAHTGLRESVPAEGATLTEAPPVVTLTFSAAVRGPEVSVAGPDGTPVGGAAAADGSVVTVPVALTTAGTHTVTWAVTSADGHRLDGVVAFTFAPAVPAPTTPATMSAAPSEVVVSAEASEAAGTGSTDDESGGNALVTSVVLLVLLGAVLGTGVLLRRRGSRG